jgi:hypothetical protein
VAGPSDLGPTTHLAAVDVAVDCDQPFSNQVTNRSATKWPSLLLLCDRVLGA